MQSKAGEIYEGKVTGLTGFGAFVKLENGESGMVHISEISSAFVKDIHDFLAVGQDVKVKVLSVGEDHKISLSIKQASGGAKEPAQRSEQREPRKKPDQAGVFGKNRSQANAGPLSFEDMMAKFKADSEEKISALRRTADLSKSPRRGNKS